jgi:hypothetical protein
VIADLFAQPPLLVECTSLVRSSLNLDKRKAVNFYG